MAKNCKPLWWLFELLFFDFMILNLHFAIIFLKAAFLWLKVWLELLTCLSSNWGSEKSWICYSFFVKIFPLAGVSINHTHTGWDVTSQEVILVVFWQLSEWWWHYTHTVYTFTKKFLSEKQVTLGSTILHSCYWNQNTSMNIESSRN